MSLRSLSNGETYHPVTGPMAEARRLHVEQQGIRSRALETGEPFVVWDIGLGAGANAIAAIEALEVAGASAVIESFDRTSAPLEFAARHAGQLGYPERWVPAIESLLERGEAVVAEGRIRWRFHRGEFPEILSGKTAACSPHAVFHDPYSPKANPGMWEEATFAAIRCTLDPERPCVLTTYSRSTAVRATLLLAGFFVGRGWGIAEKDETTIAASALSLLERPLGEEWLRRLRRSTNGAPLRPGRAGVESMRVEDFETISRHSQFSGDEFGAP